MAPATPPATGPPSLPSSRGRFGLRRQPAGPRLLAGALAAAALLLSLLGPAAERPARLGILALAALAGAAALVERAWAARVEARRDQALLEGLNAGVWRLDRNGRTAYANARLCELVGQPLSALRDRPLDALLHPDHEAESRTRLGPVLAAERAQVEVCLRRGDGRELWALLSTSPVEGPQGELEGTLLLVSDVTAHHRAERARQLDTLFAAAVRASRDAVVVFRADDERILDVNPAWCATTGWTREEVLGRRQRDLGIWLEDASSDELARQMQEHGGVQDFTFSFRRRSGELGQAVLWSETVMLDGVAHVLAIGRDVTEARREEARLQEARKLEDLGRLAAGVAHDFNNLLSIILTYAYLVLESLGEDHPRAEDVREVQRAAEQAAQLTLRLLTFSRRGVVEVGPLDLNALLEGMERLIRPLVGERVELQLRLARGLPPIHADTGQLEQAILNLAANARDAMPEGGVLTLTTAPGPVDVQDVERGASTPRSYVVLSVSDTGTGMAPGVAARIFEPLFTTKEPGRGTGLGLSLVQGVVRQAGGYVRVDSELGRGSRFDLFLPMAPEGSLAPARAHPEPFSAAALLHGAPPTVVLVEDEPAVRAVARRVLEETGCQVLEAVNGQEALALVARTHPVDLVLSDVVMPRLGGRAFAARLAQLRPSLRVLFMSGYSDDPALLVDSPNVLPHLVRKPFTPQALRSEVLSALQPAARNDESPPASRHEGRS